MTHRFPRTKKAFPNRPLPLDRPCASSVGCSTIARAFVHKYKLVWDVGEGHMLTEILAPEFVPFDSDLRQLRAAISKPVEANASKLLTLLHRVSRAS